MVHRARCRVVIMFEIRCRGAVITDIQMTVVRGNLHFRARLSIA